MAWHLNTGCTLLGCISIWAAKPTMKATFHNKTIAYDDVSGSRPLSSLLKFSSIASISRVSVEASMEHQSKLSIRTQCTHWGWIKWTAALNTPNSDATTSDKHKLHAKLARSDEDTHWIFRAKDDATKERIDSMNRMQTATWKASGQGRGSLRLSLASIGEWNASRSLGSSDGSGWNLQETAAKQRESGVHATSE